MTPDHRHESGATLDGAPAGGVGLQAGSARKGAAASTPLPGTPDEETSGIDAARERWLADVPPKYRDLYRRAYSGNSRKAAIRAHCLECCGWSADEVRRCTAPACPLYEFRLKG